MIAQVDKSKQDTPNIVEAIMMGRRKRDKKVTELVVVVELGVTVGVAIAVVVAMVDPSG